MPAFRRQKQAGLGEVEASLISIVSSRPGNDTQQDLVSNKARQEAVKTEELFLLLKECIPTIQRCLNCSLFLFIVMGDNV